MEAIEKDETDSVRGLLDSDRVAKYLDVKRATLRSWENRKRKREPGLHMSFPDPLNETLGGTALWDDEEIRAFKVVLDEIREARREKRKKPVDASDMLQAVESENE